MIYQFEETNNVYSAIEVIIAIAKSTPRSNANKI